MDAKKMGSFIAVRRRELGLTQKQLADRIAVTDKAVSRWERGRGCPDIALLQPLAAALQVSLTALMQGEPNAPAPDDPPQVEAALARQMIREIDHRRYTAYLVGTSVCFIALVLCAAGWFPLLMLPADLPQDAAAYPRWLSAASWARPGLIAAFIGLFADSASHRLTSIEKLPRLRTFFLLVAALAFLCGFGLLCAAYGLIFPL